jgi:hypothetical protein
MLLNLRKLHSHVSKHRISLQEYKDQYLSKNSSTPSRSAGAAATTNTTISPRKPIKSESLAMETVEQKSRTRLSDRLAEVSRVRCNICEADVQYDELLRHLRAAHGLATKEGYGEYRFSLHRLHACRLCDRQVLFTRKNVGAHTLKVHQIVFPVYARKFLVDVPLGKNCAKLAPGTVATFQ